MKKLSLLFGMFVLITSLSTAQTDQTWIDLDGTDDYLDLGTDPILAGKTQFTVEMKIHFDNSTGDYTIIGQRTADDNRTIVLQRWADAFYVFLSNSNYGYCSFIPCEATLYHIAIVFDGAGASNSDRLKLYINGILQTLTFNGTIDAASYTTSPAANLVLGCEHNDASFQLQYVDGQFGEFCVWNYPLSSTEINNRIIPEVTGTETGLVEYFHFDNGLPGGDNAGITSFAGGNGVSTITLTNMLLNGASSNFVVQPELISPVDISITVVGSVITASATDAIYQWLNCDNGFAIIPDETSQSYTATANGNYAVRVTQGACTDTSVCVQISSVGIATLLSAGIVIYPNPVMNELIIETNGNKEKLFFEILNSKGQVVYNGNFIGRAIVQTSGFAPGIYVLKMNTGNAFEIMKLVKE